MGRGVGAEDHPDLLPGLFVDVLVDRAGLAHDGLGIGVGVADRGEVFGEVDHHREVDRLPRKAGAAAPGEDRRAVGMADAVGRDYVLERLWDHHAERHLAEVRGVGRVKALGRRIEADLALELCLERSPQRAHVDLVGGGHAAAVALVDPCWDCLGAHATR